VRESRTLGSVGAKAKWLSYPTMAENENTPTPEGEGAEGTSESAPSLKRSASMAEGLRARHEAEKSKPKEDDDNPENEEPMMGEEDKPQQDDKSATKGYDLDVPDEVPREHAETTKESIEQAGVLAKELGIAQETVQTLVDYAVALGVSDESGVDLANQDACVNVLMARYGDVEGKAIVKDARAAVTKLGPKVSQFLDGPGQLGNSPAVLMALAAYHRGDMHLSPEAAATQIEDLRTNKAYLNSNDKGHKLARDRAALLYQRLTKGGDVEAAPKKAAAKMDAKGARAAQLDREIAALIRHPAYLNKGHAEHGTVKAKAEALYAERWPGDE